MNAKKWILSSAGALCLIGIIAVGFLHSRKDSIEKAENKAAIRELASIRSADDLSRGIGVLGAWFTFSTNEWLAIHYQDGKWPEWSVAVARDSDDKYYRSEKRFGGALASYLFKRIQYERVKTEKLTESYASYDEKNRSVVDRAVDGADPALVPGMAPLHAITISTNLAAARSALQAIGFEPFDP
jgi:hypothetical protein